MATFRVVREGSSVEAQGREDPTQATSNIAVQNEVVDFHNTLRSQVSPAAKAMKPITWSTEAAEIAQAYANKCVWGHSSPASRRGMGENIAMSTGTAPTTWTTAALKPWADEKAGYKYPGAGGSTAGHYTQMIWADSTGVGCGFKRCAASSNPAGSKYGEWNFYVCNYTPAGNIAGQAPYQKK